MTLRSLYRLERARLLTARCSVSRRRTGRYERLREHAREAIRTTGEQLDEACLATVRRAAVLCLRRFRGSRRPTSALAGRWRQHVNPVFYLEIPPSLFATVIDGLAGASLCAATDAGRRREAVRPRPRLGAGARRSLHRTSTSLSSTGSITSWARWGSRRSCTCASRTRCSSRSGTATIVACVQITMAETFGVEDRGRFYDPVGALRDVVVNHLLQLRRRGRDGAARPAATPTR